MTRAKDLKRKRQRSLKRLVTQAANEATDHRQYFAILLRFNGKQVPKGWY